MEKYIKVSDLMILIDNMHKEIQNDYDDEKICYNSKIAMDGTLGILKQIVETYKNN